mmetsp:Transcript_1727/g.2406  ORF Transcript_1727/g.2406 Transcript_1727/m.2406 type:complete len:81 (+) Transcript_1727:249-491(+)
MLGGNDSSLMTSNVSGIKPDRDVSHDSTSKRRASRHPAAQTKFKQTAARRRSLHRHMGHKGEIQITINLLDGETALKLLE